MNAGNEYNDALITDESGIVSNPLLTITNDRPHIFILHTDPKTPSGKITRLELTELESMICESERVGVIMDENGKWHPIIKDVDELPGLLRFHKIYKEHKEELDKLLGLERVDRILELDCLRR
jgi:hypothetical protein